MHLFSASENVFIPANVVSLYETAGTLPSDLVEVDANVFEKYTAPPPTGMTRGVVDGQPGWVATQLDPADVRRQRAINWLDATADRIRASDRSVGQYLDAEYQLVAQALADYRNDPSAEVPEAIQSHAAAAGLAVEGAAEQIAEAAARAEDLLQNVRRIRLAGKAAIRGAGDDADFMETARLYIDRLQALSPDEKRTKEPILSADTA